MTICHQHAITFGANRGLYKVIRHYMLSVNLTTGYWDACTQSTTDEAGKYSGLAAKALQLGPELTLNNRSYIYVIYKNIYIDL